MDLNLEELHLEGNEGFHDFHFQVPDVSGNIQCKWSAKQDNGRLFIKVPVGNFPPGSKESFVSLLEKAEGELNCEQIYVFFNKDREDKDDVIRAFLVRGFTLVNQNNPDSNLILLGYNVE